MDKKNTNSKTGTANKTNKPQNTQQSAAGADAKKQQSNKDVKASTAAPKKEGNKLNPVKPRGKNSEAEKKSLKQNDKTAGRNAKFNVGGKNAKKEKKEPEKELYLRFGKKVLNNREEEQDLDDNTFLRYNVIGILFTGSWVPPAKEFMVKLEELYAEINKTEKIFEIVQIPNEKSEAAYKESLTDKRPWLYLPFNDPFIKTLVEQFNVEFLPTFIIVNRDFFILSTNGRKDMIDNEGVKAYEKWYKAYRDRKQALENEREEKEEQLNRAET
jgi:hypothetical protein